MSKDKVNIAIVGSVPLAEEALNFGHGTHGDAFRNYRGLSGRDLSLKNGVIQ